MSSRFFKTFLFTILILGLLSVNPGFTIENIRVPVKLADAYVAQTPDKNDIISVVSASVAAIDMYKKTPQYVIEYRGNRRISYEEVGSVKTRMSSGTAFVIRSDGYLLTNAHIVYDDDAEYVVSMSDGKEFEGEIVYKDYGNDLAVVKISANGLPELNFARSDTELGDNVFAIGNAFGQFQNIVSTGEISGLQRNIIALGPQSTERLKGLIETNAQMYPGNSGGPLFNDSGNVIGINVAIAETENQSYSIPIDVAREVLKDANIGID